MILIKRTIISVLVGYIAMFMTTMVTTDGDVILAVGLVSAGAMFAKFKGWLK